MKTHGLNPVKGTNKTRENSYTKRVYAVVEAMKRNQNSKFNRKAEVRRRKSAPHSCFATIQRPFKCKTCYPVDLGEACNDSSEATDSLLIAHQTQWGDKLCESNVEPDRKQDQHRRWRDEYGLIGLLG
jgi:hypothetical protein